MSQTEAQMRLRAALQTLGLSLAINGLVPLVLYIVIRPLVAGDATALAIAGTAPAVRTIALWIWRRRVDWIGVHVLIGFAIACSISVLSGGNSFLLKVHGSLLTGTIGLVFLISVVMRKPLPLPFLQALTRGDSTLSSALEKRSSDSASGRRITVITAAIGCVFLADAVAHIILALTLPTATFLAVSRVVNWSLLGGGAALLWWIRRRAQGLGGQTSEHS